MENFEFCMPVRIVFGKGTENSVGNRIKQLGATKVLLHYGGGSIKKTGLYDRVCKSLSDAGLAYVELPGVQANPKLSKVYEGIELSKREKIDFILAVGGGSVIDSSKAIGIGCKYEGDVWDYYDKEHDLIPAETIPVAVILTIPAAGSECSNGSVITNDKTNLKRDTGSENMRPVLSILNPELAFTLPKYNVACGLADILAHIMERYFTNSKNVNLTDGICEAGMRTVIKHAEKVLNDPCNYNSWAEIMWTGTLGHNDLMSTGRIGDWASHMIEHELSGMYDIAHGAGLAVVFPAWMKYVYRHDINRFAQFANKVFNIPFDLEDMEGMAIAGIKKLEEFFRYMGLPTKFSEVGGKTKDIPELAKNVVRDPVTGTTGHFVELDVDDIKNILEISDT